MAIQVNVISENNAFTVENANYCTVALPITACWGPGFSLPTANTANSDDTTDPVETALENTAGVFSVPAQRDLNHLSLHTEVLLLTIVLLKTILTLWLCPF